MASTERWQAKEANGGLVLAYGNQTTPITKGNAMTLVAELSAFCAGGGETTPTAMSASKTVTAPPPSAGKGAKKKTRGRSAARK